jgi:protein MAK11
MAKRKRPDATNVGAGTATNASSKKPKSATKQQPEQSIEPLTIQIVAGSYDRILHGITASITSESKVEFSDTFLFNAHTSAIRCLAISPPSVPLPGQTQKVFLASGSTDERINVYNLSAHPPNQKSSELISSVAPRPISENSKNRELGTLLHHASTVTKLSFPTRSKLLSSSEDSTIGVTRTRDWSLLSTVKAPKPKPLGRPSGDTAPFGGTPAGINDFAIHPSMKLMISVSKGERCMRLWNLVTGKKAGVLNFGRDMLRAVGESKHSAGEGRKVVWGSTEAGDEFAVAFDRNVLVFGMDSVPKCRLLSEARTKIHGVSYLTVDEASDLSMLAVSTEDGRILFFSTREEDLIPAKDESDSRELNLPLAKLVAELGGKEAGVSGRIKDFTLLKSNGENSSHLYIVTGSSDGKLRVWALNKDGIKKTGKDEKPTRVGKLLGTYETQNRITCLVAFVMIPRPDGVEDSEEEEEEQDSDDEEDEEEDQD